MCESEVLRRAAEVARSEGSHVIKRTHLRRSERELGETVEVKQ